MASGRKRTQQAKAFAAAARHSAHVRFLRVALLGGAVGTVALLISIALFDPFGRLAGGVSMSGIGVDGTKVTMEHPRLAGFRKDGRPYLVNARKAVQDALHPTLVELHEIDADIALAEGGLAHMTANSGLYDSSKEHMDVSDNVRLKSPQYDMWLKSASIDFHNGLYVSKEPVTIVTSTGTTLAGDAISAVDNGKELTLEGHVKTTIPPASAADETQAQLKGANP
ncbi:LPS export ABC transporter periplasmic protein LptC [Methylocapsa sp. S129]|uniref:LPS export ABC transporter periplasmic protein LptC n=1 Tax=Methylocapsa sp. S129 TaxID=1641869 RepID=UPI00131CFF72|nr:LPS export ABC transporter periplasmic protein LptC [Methylocapsa sp. S129]